MAAVLAFGRLKKLQENRWGVAGIAFVATLIADFFMDHSHYGGIIGEPLVPAFGAALLSLLLSSTALGRFLENLEAPKPPERRVRS